MDGSNFLLQTPKPSTAQHSPAQQKASGVVLGCRGGMGCAGSSVRNFSCGEGVPWLALFLGRLTNQVLFQHLDSNSSPHGFSQHCEVSSAPACSPRGWSCGMWWEPVSELCKVIGNNPVHLDSDSTTASSVL